MTAESKETFCYYSHPVFRETDHSSFLGNDEDHFGDSSIHSLAAFSAGRTYKAQGLLDRHAARRENRCQRSPLESPAALMLRTVKS